MTIFIGDVHGKFSQYREIIREHRDTIQVGDMGVGFIRLSGPAAGDRDRNPNYEAMVAANARFIRGNHDNPAACARHTQCIKDGTVEGDTMFVGGAFSIDHMYRQEGFNWWKDEEVSAHRLIDFHDQYVRVKPRRMVTHDCPIDVIKHIHGSHHLFDNSRTQQALQAMWSIHKPKVWVFGHHHHSFDQVIEGTRFVCLAELETKDIE